MDYELDLGESTFLSMFRFRPTPFEALQYYLVPKLRGEALPSDYIKDLDVYKYDPEQIPLDEYKDKGDDDRAYFFVPLTEEILRGKDNATRTTPNGYWKISEGNVPLYGPDGKIIGLMNKLEFYCGKDPNGVITDWKMTEYMNHLCVCGRNAAPLMICKMRLKARWVVVDDEMSEEETSSEEEEGNNNSK
ncbi:Putative NAC domain-containing protein 61 [Striga hermonthica]|uniref:NAC domain-containing protein 61 n=1 Tax=Striga hermonthica TaxID=68872 RepID=A0A9N7NZE6_STRHE|nr:Putative NAC domain-containing protein 61 [Striga hermonthica]